MVFAAAAVACTVKPVPKEQDINLPGREVQEGETNADPVEPESTSTTSKPAPVPEQEPAPKPQEPAADAGTEAGPSTPTGKWYQANNLECTAFCAEKGLANVPSPEGAKCTSGENIPQSAIGVIDYNNCYPNCNAHLHPNARSYEDECYGDGQKQDGDGSDRTRGCFCQ